MSNSAGSVTSRAAFVQVKPAPILRLSASIADADPARRHLWAETEPGLTFFLQTVDELETPWAWKTLACLTARTNVLQWADSDPRHSRYYRLQVASPTPEVGGVFAAQEMVWIEPGSFTMGSPADEPGRFAFEGPQTRVTLTRGFFIGRYEVTQGQYQEVSGSNPSSLKTSKEMPVHSVTFEDARAFCALLSEHERDAGRIPADYEYRLPTEAEWEYAARAGTTTAYYFGAIEAADRLADYEWYQANSGAKPHAVGQKLPNPWGLHDILGNVREWCSDFAYTYPGGEVADPVGPATGTTKTRRGGGYDSFPPTCRTAGRLMSITSRLQSFGFRIVLSQMREP